MNVAHRFLVWNNPCRRRTTQSRASRCLAFQPLEPRQLLAGLGDWSVIDLRAYLTDASTQFWDLSGVVFHGDQVAVTANVQPDGADLEARLLLVDVDLDAHTAQVADALTIPSLGGANTVLAVNSNGSVVYMTGYSVTDEAVNGEAFRGEWDGIQFTMTQLGSIGKEGSVNPEYQSIGVAINSHGVVAGMSDNGRALFEYDQAIVRVGELVDGAVVYGISDDRVKVGIDITGVVWEADNATRREVGDPYGDGVYVFGISPDSSTIVGSSFVFGVGGHFIEKLMWWDYDGTAHAVRTDSGGFIDGRLTGATNSDVGYLVGRSNPAEQGDLLHIRSTNQTLRIVDWFESLSGQSVPGETSLWGPEIAYDADTGRVAIISGGHLFTAIITNEAPVAVPDSYTTAVDVPLIVPAPGVLANDSDDGIGTMRAVLVSGPAHGLLTLNDDGSFTYVPDAGFNREDAFTYKVNDGGADSNVVTVDITLETEYPWYNGAMPLDVDDDGHISGIDALQIINRINIFGPGNLPTRPHPFAAPFYDTSPDNVVTGLDALLVINYINRTGTAQGEGQAEGEGAGPVADLSSDGLVGSSDAFLAVTTGLGGGPSLGASQFPLLLPAAAGWQLPPPAAREADGWEVGFAEGRGSRGEACWAEWAESSGRVDLEDLLSALLGVAADES